MCSSLTDTNLQLQLRIQDLEHEEEEVVECHLNDDLSEMQMDFS